MFREEPNSPSKPDAIEQARQYATAYAYAVANNPFGVMNTDPQHIKDRNEREHDNLMMQWDCWKNLGLLDTEVVQFLSDPEAQATRYNAASPRRQKAASDYVETFCCLVCDCLPKLAAEGAHEVRRVAAALLAAADETTLTAPQLDLVQAIGRALLRASAQQRLDDLQTSRRPPHDGPDRVMGNIIPWPVVKKLPPNP